MTCATSAEVCASLHPESAWASCYSCFATASFLCIVAPVLVLQLLPFSAKLLQQTRWLANGAQVLRYVPQQLELLLHMYRVHQNRIYAPYMTVYVVISLPKMPYIRRIYMVLANPTHITW